MGYAFEGSSWDEFYSDELSALSKSLSVSIRIREGIDDDEVIDLQKTLLEEIDQVLENRE